MKIFIYKIIIVLIGFFLLFEFTIGSQIKDFKRELVKNISNENLNSVKEKIKSEIRDANNQDSILDKEDAKLLKTFLNKLYIEIKNSD
tara:strand:- start:34 stop:297 length:264 start_codon:yes stop_codon:yes gene_type:complete